MEKLVSACGILHAGSHYPMWFRVGSNTAKVKILAMEMQFIARPVVGDKFDFLSPTSRVVSFRL